MKLLTMIIATLFSLVPMLNSEPVDNQYECSEQAEALLNYENEYCLFINDLCTDTFGYQYTMYIWIDSDWVDEHGVDAKQHGEMEMIMDYHTDCCCELWYIVVDESMEGYDYTLYLHADGAWHTFYGYLG